MLKISSHPLSKTDLPTSQLVQPTKMLWVHQRINRFKVGCQTLVLKTKEIWQKAFNNKAESHSHPTSVQTKKWSFMDIKNKISRALLGGIFLAPLTSQATTVEPIKTTIATEYNFTETVSLKAVDTINNSQSIPGLNEELFISLKKEIINTWETLKKDGVIEISATDKEVRPYFVTLQGILEHVLASELNKGVKTLTGLIHTPMPATPLCTAGEISKELVDPSIELDATRLFTVKARTTILRDYLFKGAVLFCMYPKDGLKKRTEAQQLIYKKELENYPNLFDAPLSLESIPDELVGATYFIRDQSDKLYVFSIKMTQAKDPKEIGSFGLWFGPVDHPAIQKRLEVLTPIFEQKTDFTSV